MRRIIRQQQINEILQTPLIENQWKKKARGGVRWEERDMSAEEKRARRKARTAERNKKICDNKDFYASRLWLHLRYQAIAKYGRVCMACGRSAPRVEIHVDHIKPRFKFPELALKLSNLQILCRDCNRGKGCKDDTDFRPTAGGLKWEE